MSYRCYLFFKLKEIDLRYKIIMNDKLKQQIFRYIPEPKPKYPSIFGEAILGEISYVNTLRKFLKPAINGWVMYFPKFQDRPEVGLAVYSENIFVFKNKFSEHITVDCKKIAIKFIKIST